MTEHGVPFHRPSLLARFNQLLVSERRCFDYCRKRGLLLSNTDDETGTNKSKQDFIRPHRGRTPECDALNHPSLQFTDVLRALSFSESRHATPAHRHAPRRAPPARVSWAMLKHGHASKLLACSSSPSSSTAQRQEGRRPHLPPRPALPGEDPLWTHPPSPRVPPIPIVDRIIDLSKPLRREYIPGAGLRAGRTVFVYQCPRCLTNLVRVRASLFIGLKNREPVHAIPSKGTIACTHCPKPPPPQP